jgi:hypothetical protein
MTAEYYNAFGHPSRVVRIFSQPRGYMVPMAIMDCFVESNSLDGANEAIKRCNLCRKEKWGKKPWGYETRVSWRKK